MELVVAAHPGQTGGPQSGRAVKRLGRRQADARPRFIPGELCCDIDYFSPHAKVRIAAHDRDGLERLCVDVARRTAIPGAVSRGHRNEFQVVVKEARPRGTDRE